MSEINLSKDIRGLTKQVKLLRKVPTKKLDDAICDIIEIGGYSLAVLLDRMSSLPIKRQLRVAQKIEDFLFFHPDKGKKLIARMKKAASKVHSACLPSILAALVDVSEKTDRGRSQLVELLDKAVIVLKSDADLPRKSRVVEIIVEAGDKSSIPVLIETISKILEGLDKYANYHFIETSLLALKRLGGDPLLRLLIDPDSVDAIKQMRIEWRSAKKSDLANTMAAIKKLDENFAQIMLKVIDLSEFNLPFIAMIKEGLSHNSKWVRQAAAASMKAATEALNVEAVTRMLNDPANEVRLMAVSSLGGFDSAHTGELLLKLAAREGEALDIRLNALYALHSQKNLEALKELSDIENIRIAVNAKGLSALLMPHDEGLELLLSSFVFLKEEFANDMAYFLLELLEPEDLRELLKCHRQSKNETHKERLINLTRVFLGKKEGPRLVKAISALKAGEQKAIKLLIEGLKA